MSKTVSLIITSIASPNDVLRNYANNCKNNGTRFILIGDRKSPIDFEINGCDFYSVDNQKKLPFKSALITPENHYARKNLGYLIAAKDKTDIIIETDDDNLPLTGFWDKKTETQQAKLLENTGWTNIYSYFSPTNLWPRGFSLDHLLNEKPDISKIQLREITTPIQQGLADVNPDVDAIYRLTNQLPLSFTKSDSIALGNNSICPFNSQNTTWFRKAFMLMYLPSYCSFRMTDIWRSFVAQRIAWTAGWSILFHTATVYQERNVHNLIRDFEQEIPGYLNNHKIMESLCNLDLKSGEQNLVENLLRCYQLLCDKNWVGKEELPILEAWIDDMHTNLR